MSYQQRPIFAAEKSLMIQLVKLVVWKLKQVDMPCGDAQKLVRSGFLLTFLSNTIGYSLTRL